MSEEYSYIRPETPQPWTPTEAERDYWSTWEHATGMTREEINGQWKIQKEANREWNLANADNCWYKGTFRRN